MKNKTWNTPEIETLEISNTANGEYKSDFETLGTFVPSKSN